METAISDTISSVFISLQPGQTSTRNSNVESFDNRGRRRQQCEDTFRAHRYDRRNIMSGDAV